MGIKIKKLPYIRSGQRERGQGSVHGGLLCYISRSGPIRHLRAAHVPFSSSDTHCDSAYTTRRAVVVIVCMVMSPRVNSMRRPTTPLENSMASTPLWSHQEHQPETRAPWSQHSPRRDFGGLFAGAQAWGEVTWPRRRAGNLPRPHYATSGPRQWIISSLIEIGRGGTFFVRSFSFTSKCTRSPFSNLQAKG